jgi:hypothetical protein
MVQRDSHCLFKALIVCMQVTELSHWDLRKKIVDFVLLHWEHPDTEFATFIRSEHENEIPHTYRERMLGAQKDWGDFPEILAAARVLSLNPRCYISLCRGGIKNGVTVRISTES